MKDTELVAALRQLKINTKSGVCIGCHYENLCSTEGCFLIGLAADKLEKYDCALEYIKAVHKVASGAEKSLLRYVIAAFDPAYGNSSALRNHIVREPKRNPGNDALDALAYAFRASQPQKRITDFELCADTAELAATLRRIDDNGYYLSGVTQDASGVYTVFFRRPVMK